MAPVIPPTRKEIPGMIFIRGTVADGAQAPATTNPILRDYYIDKTEVPIIKIMRHVFGERKANRVQISGGGKNDKYEFRHKDQLIIADANLFTVLRKMSEDAYTETLALSLPYNVPQGMSQEKLRIMPATGVTYNDAQDYCATTVAGGHVTTVDEFSFAATGRNPRSWSLQKYWSNAKNAYDPNIVHINASAPRPVDEGTPVNGLQNMGGNVAEICWLNSSAEYFHCGGSYRVSTQDVESNTSRQLNPDPASYGGKPQPHVGFRCATRAASINKDSKKR